MSTITGISPLANLHLPKNLRNAEENPADPPPVPSETRGSGKGLGPFEFTGNPGTPLETSVRIKDWIDINFEERTTPDEAVTAQERTVAGMSNSEELKDIFHFVEEGEEPGEKGLISQEEREVKRLKKRDGEIRRHEQTHKIAGGQFVRNRPTFEHKIGPDGKRYAVHGEISIDSAPVPGDPKATIRKAQAIRRAALAPANPSAGDRRAAAKAVRMETQARLALSTKRREDQQELVKNLSDASGQLVEVFRVESDFEKGLRIIGRDPEDDGHTFEPEDVKFVGPDIEEVIEKFNEILFSISGFQSNLQSPGSYYSGRLDTLV